MGFPMKIRIVVLITLLMLSAKWLRADSIDMGGGSGAGPAILTSVLTIASPTGTSPGTSPCILVQGAMQTNSPSWLF